MKNRFRPFTFVSILFLAVTFFFPVQNLVGEEKDPAKEVETSTTSGPENPHPTPEEIKIQRILEMKVYSSINPATFNFLSVGFQRAKKEQFDAVLIKLNTPGGLVSTTQKIINLIGSTDIPTIIWVTPEGASATSAGAIIASGAHLLFMSEGTSMGAATPIQMSGDIKAKDARKKAINTLVSLVQSLAEARGRNRELFGKMVEEAASYKSREALQWNLIDGLANSKRELEKGIKGNTLNIMGKTKKVVVNSPVEYVVHEMDLGQKLLNIFANPNLAYLFFLIGAALIYLELQAPGGLIAGSLGVMFLILAGIGFQVLPLNLGALGLLLLSFLLFILEAYIISYGILTFAGIAALTLGSLFLFRTDEAYMQVSTSLIISAVGAISLFVIGIGYFWVWDSKRKKKPGFGEYNKLEGKVCTIVDILPPEVEGTHLYQVKVLGEIWKASSKKEFAIGDHTPIINQAPDALILII